MKTTQLALDIQAYLDGELDPARRAEIGSALVHDPEARALHDELCGIRQAIRAGEPQFTVDETREFYWSQLSRRIATEERQAAKPKDESPLLGWLRWVVPALGVAAFALVLTVQRGSLPAARGSAAEAVSHADTSAITFRSEVDGITIHWIN